MADGTVTMNSIKGTATGATTGMAIGGAPGAVAGAIVGLAFGIGSGIASNIAGKRNAEAQNKINAQYDQFNNESMQRQIDTTNDAFGFNNQMKQQNRRRDSINMKAKLTDFGEKKQRAEYGIRESLMNQSRATPANRINRLDRSLLKLKVGNNDTNS